MLSVDDAWLDDLGYLGLKKGLSELVGDLDPLSVSHLCRFCVIGVYFEKRIGIELSAIRNLTVFGMEESVRSSARRQDEGILLKQFGCRYRAVLRLLVIGERLVSELMEGVRPEFDTAR